MLRLRIDLSITAHRSKRRTTRTTVRPVAAAGGSARDPGVSPTTLRRRASPGFLEQRGSGTITITDKRMTRFWITLEQGVRFVISCIERMIGGEIFVPKIPSMRLMDIVQTVAPGARVEVIGIRPGEKLHEELVILEEAPRTKEFDTYYVIEPEHHFWESGNHQDGKRVAQDFQYGSDSNHLWLTPTELQACIADLVTEL